MSFNQRLVEESFARIEPVSDQAAGYFYGRLFAENPRLRTLYPPTMDAHRDREFMSLIAVIHGIHRGDAPAHHLHRLGRDHRRFGVLPEHYEAMGSALITTLRKFCGAHWNQRIEDAWATAYKSATAMMMRAADADALTSPPWWIAEVIGHELRTPDVAVLTLRPDQPLPFAAGQYVTVQTSRWPRVWRRYSIANAPRADGSLSLHVRAVPGGWVSGSLVRSTRIGDTVLLGAAAGDMRVDPAADRELLLVAGGTGLAPLKAMVEQVAASGRERSTHLIVGSRTEREFYDLADLKRLSAAHPWLRVTPVISADPAYGGVQGTAGAFAAGQSGSGIPGIIDPEACDAYICGPPAMVAEAVAMLRAAGLPGARIHFDALDTAVPGIPGRPAATVADDGESAYGHGAIGHGAIEHDGDPDADGPAGDDQEGGTNAGIVARAPGSGTHTLPAGTGGTGSTSATGGPVGTGAAAAAERRIREPRRAASGRVAQRSVRPVPGPRA